MSECLDVSNNDPSLVEVVVIGENQFNPDDGIFTISNNVDIEFEDSLMNKNTEKGKFFYDR